MFRKWLAVLLAILLLAAACGGSDDEGTTASEAEVTAADADEDEAEPDDADEDEAEVAEPDTDEEVDEPEDELADVGGQTVTAAPLGDRGPAPSGTIDYGWHTGFSPKWFDTSLNSSSTSQLGTQYIIHDALVRGMPGASFVPSLAEEYTVADDFTWASFRLREGLIFHDGSALTTEDVKWTYEHYIAGTGASAGPLGDNLDNIEIIDDLNIQFNFTGAFLDFMTLYGGTASGAAWILPSDYYQEVGADEFLLHPIGAGPFKFVENRDNLEIVYEAFTDYWRKNPGVERINFHIITDAATRLAALKDGAIDLMNVIPGALLDAAKDDENITVVSSSSVPYWLEFAGYDDPDSPFNDARVREAAALALNREEINLAETGGGGETVGQWIPRQWPGAVQAEPIPYDVERAKELMAEAGYPDGFEVDQITPFPNYFDLGNRMITQFDEIGIRTTLNQMDRGAFFGEINAGQDGGLTGLIVNISGAGGGAAARIANFALCEGSASRTCDPVIEQGWEDYLAATDGDEQKRLLDEIQQYIIDEFIIVYVYTLGLNMGTGPDIANPADEVWGQIAQYAYPGPYEDLNVN